MASDPGESVSTKRYTLHISRQDSLEKPETSRVEERAVDLDPECSVLAALVESEASAKADSGPVAHEGECHEGVCGACTMLVNGKARLACTTSLSSVADKRGVVRLAPLSKFPLVRDLVVDRSRAKDSLRRLYLFQPLPAVALVEPTAHAPEAAQALAGLDTCMNCGACLEACPQFGDHSEFVGAHALHQLSVQNEKANGAHGRSVRLEAAMAPGGIQNCGKAQNCVEVCPVDLPLADSLQSVARQTSRHMIFGWLLH
jgi:succinate dehydrogenase / fumarate reductase iron-sulfur subunit